MHLRILTTQDKSSSCKLLADTLTTKLGYKVWRGGSIKSHAIHVQYGDPRTKDWQYKWMKDRELPGPDYTFDKAQVALWLNEGETVIARSLINGQDGDGITVLENTVAIPDAKVYTKYFKTKAEYRVMLFQDKVMQIYEKRRKVGFTSTILKTTGNGYVLCASNVKPPKGIKELAQKFIYMNRSDIKGIDIAVDKKGNMLVLEVNSAPELGPIMADIFANTIIATFAEELV